MNPLLVHAVRLGEGTDQLVAQLVAWHLGALHAHEKALTILLAFGPFVLLAAVIVVRRRQDAAAELREARPEARPEVQPEVRPADEREDQRERY